MIDVSSNKSLEVDFSSMKRRYSLISSPIAVLPNVDILSTISIFEPIDIIDSQHSLENSVTRESLLDIFKDAPFLISINQEDCEGAEPVSKRAKKYTGSTITPKTTPKSTTANSNNKFRPYQAEKWQERYEELLEYRHLHGHCLVPHSFPNNPPLARWVKRQRYQYKLLQEKKQSSMTFQRIKTLEEIGFIWDSHEAAWQERLKELLEFKKCTGHCLVPSTFSVNPQLATWVKCQRRQYKLYWEGRSSNMTADRIVILENHGFEWELRSSSPHSRSNKRLTTESCWEETKNNSSYDSDNSTTKDKHSKDSSSSSSSSSTADTAAATTTTTTSSVLFDIEESLGSCASMSIKLESLNDDCTEKTCRNQFSSETALTAFSLDMFSDELFEDPEIVTTIMETFKESMSDGGGGGGGGEEEVGESVLSSYTENDNDD